MTGRNMIPPAAGGRFGYLLDPVPDRIVPPEVGSSGGGGTDARPAAFHLLRDADSGDDQYVVKYCRLYFGRSVLTCGDTAVGLGSGRRVYAVVDSVTSVAGEASLRLSVVGTDAGQGDLDPLSTSQCRFLLYENDGGTIVDYRNTPVVVAMD